MSLFSGPELSLELEERARQAAAHIDSEVSRETSSIRPMSADLWLGIAAGANVLAAAAITYQAVETGALADETEASLATSTAIEFETAKARLDARGPELAVEILDVDQYPYNAIKTSGEPVYSSGRFPVRACRRVRCPENGRARPHADRSGLPHQQLATLGRGDAVSTPGAATGLGRPPEAEQGRDRVGASRQGGTWQFVFPAAGEAWQWALNAEHRGEPDARRYPFHLTARVVANDRNDNGIRDEWELVIGGAPLYGTSLSTSTYNRNTVGPGERLYFSYVPAATRRYWLSKENGIELIATRRPPRPRGWSRLLRRTGRGSGAMVSEEAASPRT